MIIEIYINKCMEFLPNLAIAVLILLGFIISGKILLPIIDIVKSLIIKICYEY